MQKTARTTRAVSYTKGRASQRAEVGERAPEGARPTETKDGDPPKEWGLCAVESDWSNPSVDQAPGIGLEFVSADLRVRIPERTRAFVERPDEKDGDPPKEWGLCAVESDWSNPSVDQAPGIGLEHRLSRSPGYNPGAYEARSLNAPARDMPIRWMPTRWMPTRWEPVEALARWMPTGWEPMTAPPV